MKDVAHIVTQTFSYNVQILHCLYKRTLYHAPTHTLDRYVFTYVVEGEWNYTLRGKTYHLQPGDIYICPMQEKLSQESKPNTPCQYYALAMLGSDCQTLFAHAGLTAEHPVLSVNNITIEKKMKRIFTLLEKNTFISIARANMEFFQILSILFERIPENFKSKKDLTATHIEKIKQFIHENYHLDIGIKDICNALYLSRSYVSTLFKRECSITLKDYITEYRLAKACELLIRGDANITKIASLTGFIDFSTFYRTFKKKTGISPSQYRIEYSNEQKTPKKEL